MPSNFPTLASLGFRVLYVNVRQCPMDVQIFGACEPRSVYTMSNATVGILINKTYEFTELCF